jgi:hypothetical protein
MKRIEIKSMLENLGRAVTSGDLDSVSAFYSYPSLFLVAGTTTVLESAEQLEGLFGKGREWYISQGIVETRSELIEFEPLTEDTAAVTVRWPGFDAEGNENYTEASYYVIQLEDEIPKIRLAMTRTIAPTA